MQQVLPSTDGEAQIHALKSRGIPSAFPRGVISDSLLDNAADTLANVYAKGERIAFPSSSLSSSVKSESLAGERIDTTPSSSWTPSQSKSSLHSDSLESNNRRTSQAAKALKLKTKSKVIVKRTRGKYRVKPRLSDEAFERPDKSALLEELLTRKPVGVRSGSA